jgi:hypothetical protein
MIWLPEFNVPQWIIMFFFVLSIAVTPSDETLQKAINRGHMERYGERIMASILWICILGWAGFWS